MTEPRYMTAAEFQDEGYLMEANRQFFHPLGLALCVFVDATGDKIVGVLDDREDLEGWYYKEFTDEMQEKAFNIDQQERARYQDRIHALGYWVQPLDWEE